MCEKMKSNSLARYPTPLRTFTGRALRLASSTGLRDWDCDCTGRRSVVEGLGQERIGSARTLADERLEAGDAAAQEAPAHRGFFRFGTASGVMIGIGVGGQLALTGHQERGEGGNVSRRPVTRVFHVILHLRLTVAFFQIVLIQLEQIRQKVGGVRAGGQAELEGDGPVVNPILEVLDGDEGGAPRAGTTGRVGQEEPLDERIHLVRDGLGAHLLVERHRLIISREVQGNHRLAVVRQS